MTKIKGILFDKDGTLIDLEKSWLRAYREIAGELAGLVHKSHQQIVNLQEAILKRSGWPPGSLRPAPESPLTWATTTDVVVSWVAMPEFEHIDANDLSSRILGVFADGSRFPPEPAAPLEPLLSELAGQSIRIGLATMDSEAKANSTLVDFGIEHYFDFVTGADSGWGVKPDPGMVHGFCQHTGLEAGEIMVVGDTHADMLMASAAGVSVSVAVLTGGGTRASLEGLADHVIETIGDVPALLRRFQD